MTNTRNIFIKYILDSKFPNDIIKIITEYIFELEGHMINNIMYNNNNSVFINFKALSNSGIIYNEHLKSDLYYIENPKIDNIRMISLDDEHKGEIENIFVFSSNTIILPVTKGSYQNIYVYPNLTESSDYYLLFSYEHNYVSSCIKISDDEYCFGSKHGNIMIWDIRNKKKKSGPCSYFVYINNLLLLTNRRLTISSFYMGSTQITIQNLETNTFEHKFTIDIKVCKSYYMYDNKICILTAFRDSVLLIYDYKSNKNKSKKLNNNTNINDLIFVDDKIIYNKSSVIIGLDRDTLDILFILDNESLINNMIFLPDMRIMVKSQKLNIWHLNSRELEQKIPLRGSSEDVNELILLPNNLIAYKSYTSISIYN